MFAVITNTWPIMYVSATRQWYEHRPAERTGGDATAGLLGKDFPSLGGRGQTNRHHQTPSGSQPIKQGRPEA